MILALLLALGASPLSVSGPRSNTVARCGSTATPIASLTCETGEVLTYTDATTGTSCPNPNEDTNYTIPAINTPCFTAGYGIALHSAVTNNTVRSEAFDKIGRAHV